MATLNLKGITKIYPHSGGELYIDGRLVNDVEPKNRDIAMVFQSYALYPHMTVYDNMAFPLKLRKMPKDEIDRRVKEAAATLDITLGVRPSHMILTDNPENTLSATVEVSEMMGGEVHFHANVLGRDVVVIVPTMDVNGAHIKTFSPGDMLNLTFNGSVCHGFDKEGRNLEL